MLTLVPAERKLELVDRRRNLQTGLQNLPLALQANISRPLHEPRQVTLVLNVVTDAVVARLRREKGICLLVRRLAVPTFCCTRSLRLWTKT